MKTIMTLALLVATAGTVSAYTAPTPSTTPAKPSFEVAKPSTTPAKPSFSTPATPDWSKPKK